MSLATIAVLAIAPAAVSFASPDADAPRVPSSEERETSSSRAWLGVFTQELSDDLRDGMDYRGEGVLVNRVLEGSPAEKAGIEKGDVIVSVNDKSVRDPEQLYEAVHSLHSGDRARIEIVRDGKHQTLNATLSSRAETRDRSESGDRSDSGDRSESREYASPDGSRRVVIREAPEGMLKDMPGLKSLGDLDQMPNMEFLNGLPGMGRGRLGVMLQNLNPDLGSYFSAPDGKGALIVEVVKDSPAARAGFKPGDVILKVGDHGVYDTEDVVKALREEEGKVAITVLHKGQKQTLTAELPEQRMARVMRGHGAMGMDDGDANERVRIERAPHGDSQLHDELQQLRDEVRKLREEIKEKPQN
jgi:C-terminal processing protease CtpA/Prc